MLALARDPDADVRGSACTVPGVWDCLAPETVPALLRLARDPYARVRAAAAVAPAASRDRSVPASSTTTGSVGSGGGHGGRRTRRPSLIGPWGPAPPRATSDSRRGGGAEPGPYDECGPVFIHAEECDGPGPGPGYPVELHGARRVLRAYGARGNILGGKLIEIPKERAAEVDHALREVFADPDVALVHVRAVEFGCFMVEVRRR
nr:DUF1203 domain-containing protein [Streptomyces sp. SID4936]